jgi:hypothetical protein
MNRLIAALQIAGVGALLALGVAAPAKASEPCHTIFKAGLGYVDSCTLQQRSPYADLPARTATPPPPPSPAVVVVVVPAPVVNVKVTVKTPPAATPTPGCGYLVNVLGRCPLPGERFDLGPWS